MIKEFKIGTLYVVNNTKNKTGVHFTSFVRADNGSKIPLFDIQPFTYRPGTIPESDVGIKDYMIFTFMHDGKLQSCSGYEKDMIKYFDEVDYSND